MGVKFISVKLKASFLALENKNPLTLYWIEETRELYKGDQLYGTGALASELAAGLLSAEDYVKLQALITSGFGLNNLSPVDGSIVITREGDNTKIGTGLSAVEGNVLTVKDDGLYVAETKVPEYAIEKQSVAEDGYAVTYRLKRTVDGEVSYVGDVINIAKDFVLQSASLEVVTEDGVPYVDAKVGDPYIKMVFNNAEMSNLYVPVKGLVDVYTAGSGIEIIDNKISVKLAADTHGLVAVNGELTLNLATRKADGAMSKEDKKIVDSIPYAYVARKFDVSDTPVGTLVDYRDHEIRVMVPNDAEFTKQTVGAGGDANTFYMTFKTYVLDDNIAGYIEHINGQADSEILTSFSVDEYGRRYQPTWLGVSKYDEATETWTYYGAGSSTDKMIGWDYRIDWYNADGVMVSSDSVRINLSNEECHNELKPYYMAKYATTETVEALKNDVSVLGESCTWGEM